MDDGDGDGHGPYAISHAPSAMSAPVFPSLSFPPAGALLAALLRLRRGLAAARAALAFADAFEDLGEPEIDLALLHIDADHLNLDLVAEPIALVRVLADQGVGALEEPVIVVGHG